MTKIPPEFNHHYVHDYDNVEDDNNESLHDIDFKRRIAKNTVPLSFVSSQS